MRASVVFSAFLAGSLAVVGTAHADTLSANTILSGFNSVVFGNFSSSSDVEGPIVIGGNLSGSNTFNINPRSTPPSGFGALTVYGTASGGPYNVNGGGDVYVGGSNSARFNFNGGGTFLSSVPNTLADFEAAVGQGLSTTLSDLTATDDTITGTPNDNDVTLHAVPAQDGIAVFSLTGGQLEGFNGFDLDIPTGTTAILNVDASDVGGAISIGSADQFKNESTIENRNNVIWNFYNASSVSFAPEWGGVVLAPGAKVSNDTPIEGVLVADSFAGNGELHDYPFDGTLPSSSPTAVPEPGSLALLATALLAFGGLGWTFRRRRG